MDKAHLATSQGAPTITGVRTNPKDIVQPKANSTGAQLLAQQDLYA